MTHDYNSGQYHLGIVIGRAVKDEVAAGMSWDEAIATLKYSVQRAELNRDLAEVVSAGKPPC